jgi:deoxyribonuclease V
VAGVTFTEWNASLPDSEFISSVSHVTEYEPGSFYKRELPCILQLLKEYSLHPEIIIVDGFVYLDDSQKPGLGKHLYDALGKELVVIGVAKSAFHGIGATYEVCRGMSRKPLYVTAGGMDLEQAKSSIKRMHGPYRLPTLLKRVDRLCRGFKDPSV